MLDTDIFVAERFRLALGAQKRLIHFTAHIDPGIASMDLCEPLKGTVNTVGERARIDSHLLDEFQDQTVLQSQQTVQQMLLLDLLIPVFIRQLLTLVDRFNRFLRKFLYIHGITSFREIMKEMTFFSNNYNGVQPVVYVVLLEL